MQKFITKYRLSILNALICAVFGLPFGLVSGQIGEWIAAGLLVGILLAAFTDGLVQSLGKSQIPIRRRLLALVLAEALLAIYIVAPGYGAYNLVHPLRYPIDITPTDFGIPYQDIELTTSDGVKLAAWYVPSKNQAAVIAVHALQGNRTNTIYHLAALAEAGYGVLALDLRAHGISGGDKFAAGWNSDLDVIAALDYLQVQTSVDAERIGALGLSVGANTVLYTAAYDERIKAVWADGTGAGRLEDLQGPLPPEFRPLWFMSPVYWMYDRMIEVMSGVKARPPIKEEVKLIAPRGIMFVSAGQGWEQFQARKYQAAAGGSASLWELPQDTHTLGLLAHPDEYAEKMVVYFNKALLTR